MGLCGSSQLSPEEAAKQAEEKKRSKELEKNLARSNAADSQIHKLLLLGAGESGKSTLFKQMLNIYGDGFHREDQRMSYKPVICNNILTSMKTLCEQSELLHSHGQPTAVHPDLEPSKRYIIEMKVLDAIDPNLGAHIKALWLDPGIQHAYSLRAQYQLTDSAAYFFDRIDDVVRDNYCPSLQDVLRSRVRTTGIVENEFEIDGNKFKLFDVGGQRNERKKWIHCFSEVTAVLFVAALSEYDMVLFEDESTNRMEEALNLFDEICNSVWFKRSSMILFLNKCDLFREKIQTVPITVCFPDFNGNPNDYNQTVAFLQQTFEAKNKSPGRQIYVHVTCATDTSNVRIIFNAVKDIVIRRSLREGGLLS